MKIQYIFGIIAVVLMLALSGCGSTGEVVSDNIEASTETAEEVEDTVEEVLDNKELIKKLTEEAGLPTEEETTIAKNTTEDTVNETSSASQEVILENLKGTPEDFDLYVGDTVKITNKEVSFKHVVELWEKVDGNWVKKPIDGKHQLLPGDSYEYKFDKAGRFKWLSLTRYPDASGDITVISK